MTVGSPLLGIHSVLAVFGLLQPLLQDPTLCIKNKAKLTIHDCTYTDSLQSRK